MIDSEQLRQDLAADRLVAAARRRRRFRTARSAMGILMAAAVFGGFALRSPPPQDAVRIDSPPVSSPVPVRQAEIIESDEELLTALEDLGPMIVTRADGSKILILTAR